MGIDLQSTEPTRTELTLRQIGEAWSLAPRGRAFTEALVDFLQRQHNPHTQRAYSFSLLQFFGYQQKERGRIPTPAEIRRQDAAAYDNWLRTRDLGLREYYLDKDPSRRIDLIIYELVKRQPGIGLDDLRAQISSRADWAAELRGVGSLEHRLGCLVGVKTLRRTPSIAQIRRGEVDVGLPPDVARRVGLDPDVPVPERAFRYFVPEKHGSSAERSTMVQARLAALSAFWQSMISAGDNIREPLLRVNVFVDLLKKASRQAKSQSRRARQEKTPGRQLFEALLATTYSKQDRGVALQMASRLMDGQRPRVSISRAHYNDIRDRVLMLLLGQMGLRSEEMAQLRRRDLSGDPPMLLVRGKGDKVRRLRVPPPTMHALGELDAKLRQLAEHQVKYRRRSKASQLLEPDAPLVPCVRRWGANAQVEIEKPLGRSGIAMALRRRAERAGIEPGTEAFKKVHPHGLRHLFTKMAISAGTPVNVVQAMLGHATATQTLQYAEEHDPDVLVSRAYERQPIPPPAPEPERPLPAAPEPPAAPPVPSIEPRRLPPVLEIVEAEPEPEGLRALGSAPEPEAIEIPESPQEQAIERLEQIYERNWGEAGDRARIGQTEVAGSQIYQQMSVEAELSQYELEGAREIVEPIGAGQNRLNHTRVGKSSGLVWWLGSTGRLDPAMPVMSPSQAAGCTEDEQNAVCQGLVELWRTWMAGEQRGPTSASALALWLVEALETAQQVAEEVQARGGQWVPFDAPWPETASEPDRGPERLVFREHDPQAIVDWFAARAYDYGRYRTKGEKVLDAPLDLPAYYALADPIQELQLDERLELLDWISALTGGLPRDNSPRYSRGSRAAVGKLIQAMCTYDGARDALGEQRAALRRGDEDPATVELAERGIEQARSEVNRQARMLGADPDFDIGELTRRRVAKRKAGDRQMRQPFYLDVVASIVGEEAKQDPVLKLVALCGRTPLADPLEIGGESWDPGELFCIGWAAQTIRHDSNFSRRFAEQTGTHSECVARRLARDMYELRRKHTAGERQRLIERPDELVDWAETMAAYRVPCADVLEYELRSRLPSTQRPTPLYNAYRFAQLQEARSDAPSTRREIEEELAGLQEEFGSEIAGDFLGDVFEPNPPAAHRYTKATSRALPSPVTLLWTVLG